jgi:hypothetical protein
VVLLETNKLFSGDSSFYYLGSYVGRNGLLTGTVKVTHYAGPAQSQAGAKIVCELTWRAALPG